MSDCVAGGFAGARASGTILIRSPPPDLVAPGIQGVGNLLHMPYGCDEPSGKPAETADR